MELSLKDTALRSWVDEHKVSVVMICERVNVQRYGESRFHHDPPVSQEASVDKRLQRSGRIVWGDVHHRLSSRESSK